MDVVGEYVRLGLSFDRLSRGFVDAWTGPDAVRAEVESGPVPRAADLRARAAELLAELPSAGLEPARTRWLAGQLTGLECSARLLSTDNLSRQAAELEPLLRIIEGVVVDLAAPGNVWTLNVVGALDLLPADTARLLKETAAVLKRAEEDTRGRPGATVNLAVGYGGRREIADAVRSLLAEHAERGTTLQELVDTLEVDHIAEHLYTRGQPDPDLVIRTSGEQRLSGFLLWQTANAEFHFTDVYWPDFRRVDFLRALRDYAARHRRFGS